jgi:hypothetical protein
VYRIEDLRRRHTDRHNMYRWLGPDLIPSLSTQRAVDAYIVNDKNESNKYRDGLDNIPHLFLFR